MTTPSYPPPPAQQWASPYNVQIPTQRQGEPSMAAPPPPPAPKPNRKKWPWIAGGAILLLVIISTVSGNSGASPAATANSPAASPSAQFSAPAATTATPSAPATQAVPPASPPTVYEGRGDDVVTIAKDPGVAVLLFECPKCSSNTVVKTDGADALLVNEIGSYTGKHLIDARSGSTTSTLEIKASGVWKVTVASGLGFATMQTGTNPVSGRGDDVVLLMSASTTKAHITNRGQSNFAVWVIPIESGRSNLAINEIGSYDGTVRLDTPAVVKITSSGNWTITPS